MSRRTRLALLVAVFAMLMVGVGGVVVVRLCRVGFEEQRRRVAEIARSRAAFLSAVARFDAVESADFPGGGAAATMEQLRESHADFLGFGETGEYLFARFSLEVDRVEAAVDESEDELGACVRVRVRDTGSGMSPEVMERAFEPFFTTGYSTVDLDRELPGRIFLAKPWTAEELPQSVREVLEESRSDPSGGPGEHDLRER